MFKNVKLDFNISSFIYIGIMIYSFILGWMFWHLALTYDNVIIGNHKKIENQTKKNIVWNAFKQTNKDMLHFMSFGLIK